MFIYIFDAGFSCTSEKHRVSEYKGHERVECSYRVRLQQESSVPGDRDAECEFGREE